MELSSSRGGLYPLSLANTVKEVASLGKAGWAEASIPSIPDILLQKMEPGAATTQAAGPGHLTLSNTHGVLPNRIWPRVRPKGKWTCRCSLRRIRYSAPPLWDLTSGARSPFICLTTRRHCRSTMILRLSLPRGNLCFPDLNPCLLCHSPRTTASLPNPSRIRAQFSPAADRTCFLLPEHSHTGRPWFFLLRSQPAATQIWV